MNYFWHDVERRARRHNIPFAGRAPYPADPDLLALRVGLIAAQEKWCDDYSRATFHEWFIARRVPGVDDHIERVLASLAPTFAIGAEIFWGDDRLEEALAFAAGR